LLALGLGKEVTNKNSNRKSFAANSVQRRETHECNEVDLMEGGLLPNAVIRRGTRRMLRKRLQDEHHGDTEVERNRQREFFANDHLLMEDHWRVTGRHYQQTSEDWLKLQDERRDEIMPILQEVYGSEAHIRFQRWRVFFLACAELFGYNNGNEWFVGHYLLRNVSC
jgi:cyclopropane fatty-acyl-phospholipid synthase-like methyltransferase